MATKLVKVEAFISRPSFSVYKFILNFIHELLHRYVQLDTIQGTQAELPSAKMVSLRASKKR